MVDQMGTTVGFMTSFTGPTRGWVVHESESSSCRDTTSLWNCLGSLGRAADLRDLTL